MKRISDEMGFFTKLLNMLEKQMGANTEIALHDYEKGYDHSIVDIRNGHITGRSVGSCGNNLGLEVLRGTTQDGDRYNYITHTKDGKILRSSSLYIHGEDGRIIGVLCVNTDITQAVQFETYLHTQNNYDLRQEPVEEVFASNIQDILEWLIEQAFRIAGKPAGKLSRADKMDIIRFLDERGAFFITKSSEAVCERLNISKFTFYKYLNAIHEEKGEPPNAQDTGGDAT